LFEETLLFGSLRLFGRLRLRRFEDDFSLVNDVCNGGFGENDAIRVPRRKRNVVVVVFGQILKTKSYVFQTAM
jgi:hypothetical protein